MNHKRFIYRSKIDILLHYVYTANSYADIEYLVNTQDQRFQKIKATSRQIKSDALDIIKKENAKT